jgi:hypothetical protein
MSLTSMSFSISSTSFFFFSTTVLSYLRLSSGFKGLIFSVLKFRLDKSFLQAVSLYFLNKYEYFWIHRYNRIIFSNGLVYQNKLCLCNRSYNSTLARTACCHRG